MLWEMQEIEVRTFRVFEILVYDRASRKPKLSPPGVFFRICFEQKIRKRTIY